MTLRKALEAVQNKEKAEHLSRFFKTGKGHYGEGDRFLGITVPQQRVIAKQFSNLSLQELEKSLYSEYHEERLTAVLILVMQYTKNPDKKLFDFYIRHAKQINNWDLVDSSADDIVGHYLHATKQGTALLRKLAVSKNIWERRIAIIATYYFIRQNVFEPTLEIAELLLKDSHDLLHKAVGWMLREVGNRDIQTEESFLRQHYAAMPRTMLRYAIEKFPEEKRLAYLKGRI